MTIAAERPQEHFDESSVRPRTSTRRSSARVGAWAKWADCIDRPAPFDDLQRTGQALRMCATCPVLRACRDWALRNAVYGVAGGMTPASRARWRATHGIPEPVVTIADFLPAWVVANEEASQWLGGDVAFPAPTEPSTEGDLWSGEVGRG